jgi:hypothetical protein
MSENVITFPEPTGYEMTASIEAEPKSRDDLFAQAFRDMEGEVCDLDRMGEIAQNLIMNCAAREDGLHDLELATFAVWQLAKMAKEFRANYQKRYDGELVGVS